MILHRHRSFSLVSKVKIVLLFQPFYLYDLCNAFEIHLGLPARDFILKFRHKAVLLFKLLLLEKKVIFYCSPVHTLCSAILSLLSLHPGMLEEGLHQSACFRYKP